MSETRSLGVGVIGASAGRGWAKTSHVPAIQGVAGLDLVAVASGSKEKSDAAAKAFRADSAYGTGRELIQDKKVDIVAIAVKVPDHRDLVLSAAAAGKHIYCEWPLGRNLAESQELAEAAQRAGVRVAIGLQTRANPAAKRARELLASGAIGRVLSSRVISTTMAFGNVVEEAMAFAENPENGVTLVTIQGAHTIDLTLALLGEYAGLKALTTTQFPDVQIGNDAKHHARVTPDHMLVHARLADKSPLCVEVAGGRPPAAVTFRLEVTGDTGVLSLNGGALRGFQSGRLTLSVNGNPSAAEDGKSASLPETAVNVAGLYAALRNDILSGSSTAPDFHHAVRLHRLMDAIIYSDRNRAWESCVDWPQQ